MYITIQFYVTNLLFCSKFPRFVDLVFPRYVANGCGHDKGNKKQVRDNIRFAIRFSKPKKYTKLSCNFRARCFVYQTISTKKYILYCELRMNCWQFFSICFSWRVKYNWLIPWTVHKISSCLVRSRHQLANVSFESFWTAWRYWRIVFHQKHSIIL